MSFLASWGSALLVLKTISHEALLIYDSLLTIADEVELIWRRKLTAASALFILNRFTLLSYVAWAVVAHIDSVSLF